MEVMFDREFWLNLRNETSFKGVRGDKMCTYWCFEAINKLEKIGLSEGFNLCTSCNFEKKWDVENKGALFHNYLVKEHESGLFIADGTAGQLDKNFFEGYYGFLKDAKPSLLQVYNFGEYN